MLVMHALARTEKGLWLEVRKGNKGARELYNNHLTDQDSFCSRMPV